MRFLLCLLGVWAIVSPAGGQGGANITPGVISERAQFYTRNRPERPAAKAAAVDTNQPSARPFPAPPPLLAADLKFAMIEWSGYPASTDLWRHCVEVQKKHREMVFDNIRLHEAFLDRTRSNNRDTRKTFVAPYCERADHCYLCGPQVARSEFSTQLLVAQGQVDRLARQRNASLTVGAVSVVAAVDNPVEVVETDTRSVSGTEGDLTHTRTKSVSRTTYESDPFFLDMARAAFASADEREKELIALYISLAEECARTRAGATAPADQGEATPAPVVEAAIHIDSYCVQINTDSMDAFLAEQGESDGKTSHLFHARECRVVSTGAAAFESAPNLAKWLEAYKKGTERFTFCRHCLAPTRTPANDGTGGYYLTIQKK